MTIKNTRVKCDEPGCGWAQECLPDEIPAWHKKPCPQCAAGEIISDADLEWFRGLKLLCALDEYLDPEKKQPRQIVRFDSREMKKCAI